MAAGDATAADVPAKYDVVIGGKGYVLLDSIQSSIPFRTHRAIYDITPTFVERQNVTGSYGDDMQSFFLTESQHSWANGEQQKYYLPGDDAGRYRFWKGTNLDIDTPGQATLRTDVKALTNANSAPGAAAEDLNTTAQIWVVNNTTIDRIRNLGASFATGPSHGFAGSVYSMATDPVSGNIYVGDGVVVKLLNTSGSGTIASFSTSPVTAMCVANQTLYGWNSAALVKYDSLGSQSTVFQFKDASGNNASAGLGTPTLKRFGGKLLVLFRKELWQYDGTNTNLQAEFPSNFNAYGIVIENGVAYISGIFTYITPAGTVSKPALFEWDGSTINLVFKSALPGTGSGQPAICRANGKILFYEGPTNRVLSYDPATGSVNAIASWTNNSGVSTFFVSNKYFAALMDTGGTSLVTLNASGATTAASGTLETGLFDFGNTLTKAFRGVRVDWVAGTDGDGGSVDIAYQVDSVDGAYSNLQTTAATGTEYLFGNVTGRAVALKITLNKGTSTYGPTLKRIYLRAAPQLNQFKSAIYVIDCTNSSPDAPRYLRNGDPHPLAGYDQVKNLLAAAQATTPFSVTDKINGTFTGLVDLQDPEGWDVYEVHPDPSTPTKPGAYVVRVKVREV